MKKYIAMMLTFIMMIMCLGLTQSVFAEAVDVDYKIVFNGVEKSDILLKSEDDRTLIPIRDFAEMLNATVYWIDETKTIQIVMQDRTIVFRIDAPNVTALKIADGKAEIRVMDVPLPGYVSPKIINEKTYIPLRGAVVPLIIDDVDNITEDILVQDIEGEKSFKWNGEENCVEITGDFEPVIKNSVADLLTLDSNTHYSVTGRLVYAGEENVKWRLTDIDNPEISIELKDPSASINNFWQQQLGTDDPNGCIVMMSGYVYREGDVPYLAIKRTTTGLRNAKTETKDTDTAIEAPADEVTEKKDEQTADDASAEKQNEVTEQPIDNVVENIPEEVEENEGE